MMKAIQTQGVNKPYIGILDEMGKSLRDGKPYKTILSELQGDKATENVKTFIVN